MKSKYFRFLQRISTTNKLLLIMGIGAIFYVCVFYSGTQSEGFKYVERNIGSFPAVQALVGNVSKVSLDPIGGFSEKHYGSHTVNRMIVDIEGSKGSTKANVVVEKDNDIWKITAVTAGWKPVGLN